MKNNRLLLDLIMTTKEASEKYPVADCTIRSWIKESVFDKEDYKKSGNTWIIKKDALERVLREKNMIGKEFSLGDQKLYLKYLGYKNQDLEIWYQNEITKEILENMPFSNLVHQIFQAYKKEKRMRFRTLIIDDNLKNNDNWLFEREKTWAITLKGVIDTTKDVLKSQNIDISNLQLYLKEKGIE